jgi:hypothetical protein
MGLLGNTYPRIALREGNDTISRISQPLVIEPVVNVYEVHLLGPVSTDDGGNNAIHDGEESRIVLGLADCIRKHNDLVA